MYVSRSVVNDLCLSNPSIYSGNEESDSSLTIRELLNETEIATMDSKGLNCCED